MEIWKLAVILLAIILLIVVGSKTIHRDNFAIISGDITLPASDSGTVTLSYPTGFNYTNSIPVACGIVSKNDPSNRGYNYVGNMNDNIDVTDLAMNAYHRCLNLQSGQIVFTIVNPNTSEKIMSYKIVLMKIS